MSFNLLRTTLEKTDQAAWEMQDLIKDMAHFYLFPFTLQGCINVTETGLKPEALYVNDYTYLSKVVSGDHPIVATWEDSTYFVGEAKRWKHMQNEMGARKKYLVGKFFKGAIQQDVQGLKIGSNASWGTEMTNLQERQTLQILVTTKLEREDMFKLFVIKRFDTLDNFFVTPDTDIKGLLDMNAVQFLYISEARNYYTHSGKYVYSSISFENLNDKLSDTGYSIANYVQMARAGEGYTWPRLKLLPENEIPESQQHNYEPNPNLILRPKREPAALYSHQRGKKMYVCVIVDPWKVIDVGVWGCQFRIDNTAIIHSVRLMGYPTNYDAALNQDPERPHVYDQGFIFAPRPLLPKYLIPSVAHPLNTHLNVEESYYTVIGIQPIIDFYQEWKENKKSAYDESIKSSFEGHIRTNWKATTKVKFSLFGKTVTDVVQIWKNFLLSFKEGTELEAPNWPAWLIERVICIFPPNIFPDLYDFVLDMPRNLLANIFSRKLPRWGNVNEKLVWKDLKQPTVTNILSLNGLAHHDLLTLPIGINQTITVETMDMVSDATSRFPRVGDVFNWVIQGFHNAIFGKSPSGFKKGGIDDRLKYYGDSMVGFMSKEFYNFYTGQFYKSINEEHRGIMPFNAFQDQGGEPLSTLINAEGNSTGLNFKITDIVEAGVYDTSKQIPQIERVEIVTTQHLAQFPGKKHGTPDNPGERELLGDENDKEFPHWKETETALLDKHFNTLIADTDPRIIGKFGEFVEGRRLYVVEEFCLQAIGGGDLTVTFFGQDPTVYGAQQVTIWEGRFRTASSVKKTPRAWTTTIRFGQPNIQTVLQYKDKDGKVIKEELKDALYRYPGTILADIQKRPHLPPPPIEVPGEEHSYVLFTYADEEWDLETKTEKSLKEGEEETELYWEDRESGEPDKQRVPLVWRIEDGYLPYCYWKEWNLFKPMGEGRLLMRDPLTDDTTRKYAKVETAINALECIQGIKTNYEKLGPFDKAWYRPVRKSIVPMWNTYAYQSLSLYQATWSNSTSPNPGKDSPNIPPLSIDWKYWHAYCASPEKDLPKYDTVKTLGYSGLVHYESRNVGSWGNNMV